MEPGDALSAASSESQHINSALSVLLEYNKEMSKNMSELASSLKQLTATTMSSVRTIPQETLPLPPLGGGIIPTTI
jgi:hypothetical protein